MCYIISNFIIFSVLPTFKQTFFLKQFEFTQLGSLWDELQNIKNNNDFRQVYSLFISFFVKYIQNVSDEENWQWENVFKKSLL